MKEYKIISIVAVFVLLYFLSASPIMMDDGFHYEGFAESLAKGKLDFKTYYGFHGLSIISVPIFWITKSEYSIIITSAILYLLSLSLAYAIGNRFYQNKAAGFYFMALVLLMPYVYSTMMRGFQEAALLFFILLTIYGAINKNRWTSLAWAYGGIVKPFNLVLFPLFVKDFLPTRVPFLARVVWIIAALAIGVVYLGASYYQTGHLINNAAIGSYQGNFNTGSPPPLVESFAPGAKGFLRVGANMLLHFRKILISPLAIILGGLVLLRNKKLKLRNEIVLAILLNVLLVGSLTFSFSKYLLPAAVLLALCSVSYLLKYRWLFAWVLVDSLFVFLPIWDYFGKPFWGNIYLYFTPFWLAIIIYVFANRYSHTNS